MQLDQATRLPELAGELDSRVKLLRSITTWTEFDKTARDTRVVSSQSVAVRSVLPFVVMRSEVIQHSKRVESAIPNRQLEK